MQVVVSLTVGLVIWIVGWSIGIKALDAFFVVVAIMLVSFTARLTAPWVREQLGR
jgi:hypothetical protein